MPREDKLLFDIVHAARLISEFLNEMDRAAFDADVKTQSAVLYQLSIIGEAAKLVPETWRRQHPDIPWRQIGRMRDRLIHHYFNVDLDVVWNTATTDVPVLRNYLQPLVTPLLAEHESPAAGTGGPPLSECE